MKISTKLGLKLIIEAARPDWSNQLTRLHCLVVYVKFQFLYTTNSKVGNQLLLASTSSHVQL